MFCGSMKYRFRAFNCYQAHVVCIQGFECVFLLQVWQGGLRQMWVDDLLRVSVNVKHATCMASKNFYK